jgi:GTP cyclohydrolase II
MYDANTIVMEEKTFMIKAIGHFCDGKEHKAVIFNEDGSAIETMPSTSEKIEAFVQKKAEKYDVDVVYSEACKKDAYLKKHINFDAHSSIDPYK